MTDYKKKYEEALKRAKEMSALPDDRATMEYIFPELKESEDEKIRKTLIEIFKKADMGGKIFGESITYKQVVAWLEKQGEQIPANSAKTCKDGQKPADKVEQKFKIGDLIKEKRDKYGDSIIKIEGIDSENYYYFDKEFPIKISEQDNWELVEQACE